MDLRPQQLPWQLQHELQYSWNTEYVEGKQNWTCEVEEYDLYVDPEPNAMFSFSVANKDGDIIRSEYDFPNAESAIRAAESQWKNCIKPIPRLSGKGQTFKWLAVESGSASECRIGSRNSILLQTFRDEESGSWSCCAYSQNVLLVEEIKKCETKCHAQLELEKWYKENAVHLLHIHFLHSK